MKSTSVICLVLAFVAACGVSGSARGDLILPQASSATKELVHEVVEALKGWTGLVRSEIESFGHGDASHDHHSFVLLVKYVVRPADQRPFVKKWLELRSHVKEQKGNLRFNLSKTLSDNLILYSYQEWESKEDFFEHVTSKAVKPLAEFIKEQDVALFLTSLLPIETHHHHHHHHHNSAGPHSVQQFESRQYNHQVHTEKDLTDDSTARAMATYLQDGFIEGVTLQTLARDLESSVGSRNLTSIVILTKQIVRPSVAECFVKGFLAVHEATHEEKGNLVYSLAKTLTDNLVFYGYSEWKNVEALLEHASSDYAKKYAKFIQEENIPTIITFLLPLENLAEIS